MEEGCRRRRFGRGEISLSWDRRVLQFWGVVGESRDTNLGVMSREKIFKVTRHDEVI